jgi:hypothetical protein
LPHSDKVFSVRSTPHTLPVQIPPKEVGMKTFVLFEKIFWFFRLRFPVWVWLLLFTLSVTVHSANVTFYGSSPSSHYARHDHVGCTVGGESVESESPDVSPTQQISKDEALHEAE